MKLLYILVLVVLSISATQAMADDDNSALQWGGMLDGSKATSAQIKKIDAVIRAWLQKQGKDRDPRFVIEGIVMKGVFIAELNKTLAEMKLPTIDTKSTELKMDYSNMVSFSSSSFAGVSIIDGKSKFCFPCTVGHNNFVWGVIPYERSKRVTNGAFYNTLQCFDSLNALNPLEKNQINSDNFPGTRFIPFVGKEAGKEGFYAVTDESIYFYPAELPGGFGGKNGFYKIYQITLPNGKETVVMVRKNILDNKTYVGEISAKIAKSEMKNLGIGFGDKVTATALTAIRGEVVAQIEAVTHPVNDSYELVQEPSSKIACEAFDKCRLDKNLTTAAMVTKFDGYNSEYGCKDLQAAPVQAPAAAKTLE